MTKTIKHGMAGVLCAALTAFLLIGTSTAQVTKGKKQPLKTAQWMKGVVKPHCTALKEGLAGVPKTDTAWDELALNAAILNETSHVLMSDGRCPDGTWAKAASKTLRSGSAGVLKAIEARDVEAARTAFKQLTQSCAACHKAHKPKKK